MSRCRFIAVVCAFSLPATSVAQRDPVTFLIVKPGNPAATAERAKSFLEGLGGYLGVRVSRFEGATVTGQIANREEDGLRIVDERHPALVLAPAGFYLKRLRGPHHDARVVAHIPRFGTAVEHFYVAVRRSDGPESLAALRGKTMRAGAAIDLPYLRQVVFPESMQPGEDFKIEPSPNLSDDVFLLTQQGETKNTPDALLLDEEMKHFFASDDLVWPLLKVIWKSPALPRDLVVALHGWDGADSAQLLEALRAMKDDESGARLLELMQSDGFAPPDRELIERTVTAYDRARR